MTRKQENISLKPFNTFGIDVQAKDFAPFSSTGELAELVNDNKQQPVFILGGGSNILFTKDVDALVLKNEIKGINQVKETVSHIYLSAGAGENWHSFVLHCINQNLSGVENLSLIPGCVGASPMQNIGAYGVEIKDVFEELTAFHLHDKTIHRFTVTDCGFGYRESVFKKKYKGEFVILNVVYRLSKKPEFHTSYGAINDELTKMNIQDLSSKAISDAVIRIRSSKLPDPRLIGNAGSFFKNPSIPATIYQNLQINYPNIIGYPNSDGSIKLAAGWMIEQCGLKGYREGDAGVHEKQALVLVNYANASGEQIYALSEKVISAVLDKFGVHLEREVNIV